MLCFTTDIRCALFMDQGVLYLVVTCALCFMTVVRATTTTETKRRGDNLVQGAAAATNLQPDQATPATEAGVAAAAGCAAT